MMTRFLFFGINCAVVMVSLSTHNALRALRALRRAQHDNALLFSGINRAAVMVSLSNHIAEGFRAPLVRVSVGKPKRPRRHVKRRGCFVAPNSYAQAAPRNDMVFLECGLQMGTMQQRGDCC
jgi:hypothetical protein